MILKLKLGMINRLQCNSLWTNTMVCRLKGYSMSYFVIGSILLHLLASMPIFFKNGSFRNLFL